MAVTVTSHVLLHALITVRSANKCRPACPARCETSDGDGEGRWPERQVQDIKERGRETARASILWCVAGVLVLVLQVDVTGEKNRRCRIP